MLSHYRTGVIRSIQRFRRGSASSPKLLIDCEAGKLVLKRRRDTQATPERVAFAHELQRRLLDTGFPLPPLIPVGDAAQQHEQQQRTSLVLGGRVYEAFRFLEGEGYARTPGQTAAAGAALARFHAAAAGLPTDAPPRLPSFHANPATRHACAPGGALHDADADTAAQLARLYDAAQAAADDRGVADWPEQTLHGDWHPGNMLFQGDQLVAAIDYDTARLGPRAFDLASAALQFSLTFKPGDPASWPAETDHERFVQFLSGYEQPAREQPAAAGDPAQGLISRAELDALPALMVEALITELAGVVTATGSFAGHPPAVMARTVARKARWILDHAARLSASLD